MEKMNIKEIVERIEQDGILTGSQAMGFATETSDWDYIFLIDDWNDIAKNLEELNYDINYLSEYTGGDEAGVYFIYEGKTYNVIGLPKRYYKCWIYTLGIIQSMPPALKTRLRDKQVRKGFYQGMCGILNDVI